MSTHTAVSVAPLKVIGVSTPVVVQVSNPHGVRHVAAYIEQNGQQLALFEENTPTRRFFLKRHEPARTLTFEAGKSKAPTLKEGKARLVVETVSNDLRGRTDSAAADVMVVLAAPPSQAPNAGKIPKYQGSTESSRLPLRYSVRHSIHFVELLGTQCRHRMSHPCRHPVRCVANSMDLHLGKGNSDRTSVQRRANSPVGRTRK